MGLKGLNNHAQDINSYLQKVASGQLPINHQIVYQLQDVFNLLPDVNLQGFVKAMYVKTNDQMLVVYLASLIRSIIALHNLINNKIQNRDAERNEGKDLSKEKKEKEKKEEKDSEKKDGKDADKKEKEKPKELSKKKWDNVDKWTDTCTYTFSKIVIELFTTMWLACGFLNTKREAIYCL